MTWQEVRDLRKAGQPDQALARVKDLLAEDPNDFKVRGQAEWAYFDLIKAVVGRLQQTLKANQKPNPADFRRLQELLQEYLGIGPKIPDMAASNVLNQLAKVGRHFDAFLPLIESIGSNILRPEDFDPNQYDGGTYPSVASKLAREAAAWVKSRPRADQKHLSFALDLVRTANEKAKDADKTWLEWDLALLLRQSGDRRGAAELIVRVLKHKRTEFWAWAEAGRIHREEQPELALACFCQTLRVGGDPKFLGKVHYELAELLAALGEHAQASQEAVIAAQVYDGQGWKHPAELQALLQADWYDPSLSAAEPKAFYGEHADEALALCFDEVAEYPATYLGMIEGREGKKPKPRFAVRSDGQIVSTLGRRAPILRGLAPGSAVSLVVGIEGKRRDVLEVSLRADGRPWDCAEARDGLMLAVSAKGDFATLYCARDQQIRIASSLWDGSAVPAAGNGVRAWGASNPITNRFEAHKVETVPMPSHDDIGLFKGRLRKTSKGFGFVEDVFVPAPLLETLSADAQEYAVVAIQSFDKTKDRYGWRAVVISPCQ